MSIVVLTNEKNINDACNEIWQQLFFVVAVEHRFLLFLVVAGLVYWCS